MFKNTLKRLGAIVLALAMAMSVMMVSAFASDQEGPSGGEQVATAQTELTKKLVLEGTNSSILAETFTFEVAYAGQKDTSYDAPETGAVTIGSAAYAAGESGEKPVTVTIDKNKFAGPGTYYFTVKEKAGTTDGMAYSQAEKKLAVQIYADSTAPTFYVVQNGSNAKNDGTFTNTYTTHKLTVTKQVTGSQGDTTKKFDIKVTVNGVTGETYTTNQKNANNQTVTLNSGEEYTFQLASGESVEIYNLSAGDTYTVDEVDYSGEGYTTSGEVTTATAIGTTDASVTVTNHKDASTPTGVIMNIAPYVLMVALAGGIAFFFLRRRNAE